MDQHCYTFVMSSDIFNRYSIWFTLCGWQYTRFWSRIYAGEFFQVDCKSTLSEIDIKNVD